MLLEFSSPGSETELLAETRQAFCIEHHTLVHKKWKGICKLDKEEDPKTSCTACSESTEFY